MNEELQKALVDILNGVLSAKDFVLSELPDVIAQLLLWKAMENLIFFSVGILLMFITIKGASKTWKELRDSDYMELSPLMALWLIPFITAIALLENVLTTLQIWLAPKVYLIEYAASLTK